MVRSDISIYCVAIVCLLAVAPVDAGQRSDRSSVCDDAGLIGSAYGACNSYCEALDCDGYPTRGSEKACEKSLARFLELTGEYPPCEPACPCAGGWLAPDFVPDDQIASSCYREITDNGGLLELYIEGEPGQTGGPTVSGAAVRTTDFDSPGYHFLACFSDSRVDGVSAEGSGSFEMTSTFSPEPTHSDREQNALYKSCLAVLEKIISDNDIQCEVADFRSE